MIHLRHGHDQLIRKRNRIIIRRRTPKIGHHDCGNPRQINLYLRRAILLFRCKAKTESRHVHQTVDHLQ